MKRASEAESRVTKTQPTSPVILHKNISRVLSLQNQTLVRQSSAPLFKEETPRKNVARVESTPFKSSSQTNKKTRAGSPIATQWKTLTMVRGESTSLVDLTTYIESHGAHHQLQMSPNSSLSPSPRQRQRIYLEEKKPIKEHKDNHSWSTDFSFLTPLRKKFGSGGF